MNLKEVMYKVPFADVCMVLSAEYLQDYDEINTDRQIENHRKVFYQLLQVNQVSSNWTIVIEIRYDDFDEKSYKDVYGILPDDPEHYALEFSPWSEWLGMEISDTTLEKFSLFEIAAHCLWEMTFMGYDEETIKSKLDDI